MTQTAFPAAMLSRFVSRLGLVMLALTVALVVPVSGGVLMAQEAPEEQQETPDEPKTDEADQSESGGDKQDGEKQDGDKQDGDKQDDADEKSADSDTDDANNDDDEANSEDDSGEAESEEAREAASDRSEADQSAATRRRRSDISRSSGQFLKVFEPVVEQTQKATVKIKSGKKTVALGAIVDSGGYVLTKQSELRSPLTCELSNGETVSAYVYGIHEATDLALLKIEANSIPVIRWSQGQAVDIGNWLVTVRGENDSPIVGVVGVRERLIKPKSGFMGVNLEQGDKHVVISNVSGDTPASRAGVKTGDVVLSVNGDEINEINALITKVQGYPPGEEIALRLSRDDKEILLKLVLGDAESLNPQFQRSIQQNTMGGNILSKRRKNFPLAVQHDTLLKPQECGGPVVNIDGEVVGINIARGGRVSSLMLPASLVMPIVAELKSAQLAPAVVHREAIDEINRALEALKTTVNLSPVGNETAQKELDEHRRNEKAARQALDKALKELDKTREARLRAEIAMQDASEEYEAAKKEIERLERQRERLASGTR